MDNTGTPIFEFVKCLAQAVDLISPMVADHHKRAAQIAYGLGRQLGLSETNLIDLVIAASLHDVGGLTRSDRLGTLDFEFHDPYGHAVMGYLLLKPFHPFSTVADIVRYHHVPWQNGQNQDFDPALVPIESYILHLADRVAVFLDPREEIMGQVPAILKKVADKAGHQFVPEHAKALEELGKNEAFWFNAIRLTEIEHLERYLKFERLNLNEKDMLGLINVFRRIIDFRSPFTAAHSMGVAATAESLAKFHNFSKLDVRQIYLAGLLHDIGKLAIPAELLEKPGKLSADEFNLMKTHSYYTNFLLEPLQILDVVRDWGSNHHERLDGGGYPFHKLRPEISFGARIVAVADVFTALTEDRPYRAGMSRQTAFEIINSMVKDDRLDEDVVKVLGEHLADVDKARAEQQKIARDEYDSMMLERDKLTPEQED